MMDKKFKILIVDDEEDNLALLNRTLRADFDIIKTKSPLEALEILKEYKVDLILSDHKMAEMDGVEFLKQSMNISPHCVRLLVTAYSDSGILVNAINEAKIYRYIKKPWDPSELLMIVRGATEYYILKQENDKLVYDLKDLFSGTINAIIEALDAKDSYTMGRSRRVTFLALKMAQYFKLPMREAGKLELAGLLHDIGMIGVPENLLGKADQLNPDEFDVVKRHVDHGVKILEDIKQLKDVVDIIRYHHEKYDGTGYPSSLKGEDIPLNAQIIAIADAYDGMISDRSYRNGLPHEEAMKKLSEQSGIQFNPSVVKAFEDIVDGAIKELKELEAKMAE